MNEESIENLQIAISELGKKVEQLEESYFCIEDEIESGARNINERLEELERPQNSSSEPRHMCWDMHKHCPLCIKEGKLVGLKEALEILENEGTLTNFEKYIIRKRIAELEASK